MSSRGKKIWAVHACGAALVLIAVVAFYQGVYAPWRRDVAERSRRVEQLHKMLATGEAVAAEHRRLNGRFTALRHMADEVWQRMPTTVAPSRFIEEFTQVAAAQEVEVLQAGAGAPETFPDHSKVEVNCRVSGSYASICRLLAAIDQLPQMSKVARLEIESAPNSLVYPAQVTFQLYYQHKSHDKDVKRGS